MAGLEAQSAVESTEKRVTRSSAKVLLTPPQKAADSETEIHKPPAKCTAKVMSYKRSSVSTPLRRCQRLSKNAREVTATAILKNLRIRCPRLNLKNHSALVKNEPTRSQLTNFQGKNEKSLDEAKPVEDGDSTDVTQRERAPCEHEQRPADESESVATRNEFSIVQRVAMLMNHLKNDKLKENGEALGTNKLVDSLSNVSTLPTTEEAFDENASTLPKEKSSNPTFITDMMRLVESDVITPSSIEHRTEHSEDTCTIEQCDDPIKERLFNAFCRFFPNSITNNNCLTQDNKLAEVQLYQGKMVNEVVGSNQLPVSCGHGGLLNGDLSGDLESSQINTLHELNETRVADSCAVVDIPSAQEPVANDVDEPPANEMKVGCTIPNDALIENLSCDNINDANIQLVDETSSDSEVRQKIEGIISCLNDLDENELIASNNVSNLEAEEVVENEKNLLVSKESRNELKNKDTQFTLKGCSTSRARLSFDQDFDTSKHEELFESPMKFDAIILDALRKRIKRHTRNKCKNIIYTSTDEEDNESSKISESSKKVPITTKVTESSNAAESVSKNNTRKLWKRKFNAQLSQSSEIISSGEENLTMPLPKDKSIETKKRNKFELEQFESPLKIDAVFLEAIRNRIKQHAENTRKNIIYISTDEEDNESGKASESAKKVPITTKVTESCNVSESVSKKTKSKLRKRKFNTQLSQSSETISSGEENPKMLLPKEKSIETKKRYKFELEIEILNNLMKKKLAESTHDPAILEETNVTENNAEGEFLAPDCIRQTISNNSDPTNDLTNKSMPVKMLASKGIATKETLIDEYSVTSDTSSKISSVHNNKLVAEKTKKKKKKKKKKLSILDKIPAAEKCLGKNAKASKDKNTLPKTLGWKVKSILSAGEKDVPSTSKTSLKKNRKNNSSQSFSQDKLWAPVSFLEGGDAECGIASRKEYRPKSQGATTDFVIQPLTVQNNKILQLPEYFSSTALDFKKNAVFNDKIRREPSKDMLKRKIRQKMYDKY